MRVHLEKIHAVRDCNALTGLGFWALKNTRGGHKTNRPYRLRPEHDVEEPSLVPRTAVSGPEGL
jgi:hypothetical protein